MEFNNCDQFEKKPKIEENESQDSVPSLISVSPEAAAPPPQSPPGFVPLGTALNHGGYDMTPVFSGMNSSWGSQAVGSPYQFHCFQYNSMCIPSTDLPYMKGKVEATGNTQDPPLMQTLFSHMPSSFYQDSVFHASFVPFQAVFQNPFLPTSVRGSSLKNNLSAPLYIEAIKDMGVLRASHGSQVGIPSGFNSSAPTQKRKLVHPSCSSSMSMISDERQSPSLQASLPPFWVNNVPNTSEMSSSSLETQRVISPSLPPDNDKVIKEKGWLVLVRKELRNTDVSNLGRIVLPKKDAEANLPLLVSKDGLSLRMEDMVFSIDWTFKYRYWPNNKSRMYVMENTGDFVKRHNLQTGDLFMVYKEERSGKYIVHGKKVKRASCAEDMKGL